MTWKYPYPKLLCNSAEKTVTFSIPSVRNIKFQNDVFGSHLCINHNNYGLGCAKLLSDSFSHVTFLFKTLLIPMTHVSTSSRN